MNSFQYIPLNFNEAIGGESEEVKDIGNILHNKFALLAIAIIVFYFLFKKKDDSKSKKSSKTSIKNTSNSVTISKRIEEDGKVTFTKIVNGKEEKLTSEDMKMIEKAEGKVSS